MTMKRFLSTNYSEIGFNIAALVIRLAAGLLICVDHGLGKIKNFSVEQHAFADPLHIGHRFSLLLVIFAEVFCALLLALGLFSRLAALVLVINMSVAAFIVLKGQHLTTVEPALLYLSGFIAILFVGPGKISVDGMMGK